MAFAQPTAPPPDDEEPDEEPSEEERVFFERWWRLIEAGAGLLEAGEIAAAKYVDLHEAEDLVHKAGGETAARILL